MWNFLSPISDHLRTGSPRPPPPYWPLTLFLQHCDWANSWMKTVDLGPFSLVIFALFFHILFLSRPAICFFLCFPLLSIQGYWNLGNSFLLFSRRFGSICYGVASSFLLISSCILSHGFIFFFLFSLFMVVVRGGILKAIWYTRT